MHISYALILGAVIHKKVETMSKDKKLAQISLFLLLSSAGLCSLFGNFIVKVQICTILV